MSANPYETLDEAPSGSVEFTFDGTVTDNDIVRATRWNAVVFVFLLLILISLFGLASSIRIALDFTSIGPPVALSFIVELIGVPAVLFVSAVWLFYFFWTRPKRFVRNTPTSMGRITGRLTSDVFEFETEHLKTQTSTRYLMIRFISETHLTFFINTTRLVPARLFDDFAGAKQLAHEIARIAKPLQPGDPRLTEPLPDELRVPAPSGSIPFEGPILASDVKATSFEHQIARARRQMLVLIAIIAAGSLLTGYVISPIAGATIGIVLLLFFYAKGIRPTLRAIRNFTEATDGTEKVSFYCTGWVDSSGVTGMTISGTGTYRWSVFETAEQRNGTLILRMPGIPSLHVFLNRRQFGSDEHFDDVLRLAESQVPDATSD